MNEFGLWHGLLRPDTEGESLVPALLRVVNAPIRERISHFAAFLSGTRHRDARVRALCITGLVGATGARTLPAFHRALDDEEQIVRAAAFRAIHSYALDEPSAWIYLAIHHRAEVRLKAIQMGGPEGTVAYELPCLADPELREIVLRRLLPEGKSPAWFPPEALTLLCDLAQRQQLPLETFRRCFSAIEYDPLSTWLENTSGRSGVALSLGPATVNTIIADPIDRLLEVDWEDTNPSETPRVWQTLLGMLSWNDACAARAVASAYATAARVGKWTRAGVSIVAAYDWGFLDHEISTPSLLASAADELSGAGLSGRIGVNPQQVINYITKHQNDPKLASPRTLAALSWRLASGARLGTLIGRIGADRIREQLLRDARGTALLIGIPDAPASFLQGFLKEMLAQHPQWANEVAIGCIQLPGVDLHRIRAVLGSSLLQSAFASSASTLPCTRPAEREQLTSLSARLATVDLLTKHLSKREAFTEVELLVIEGMLKVLPADALSDALSGLEQDQRRSVLSQLVNLKKYTRPAWRLACETHGILLTEVDSSESVVSPERPNANTLDDLSYGAGTELENALKSLMRWPTARVAESLMNREGAEQSAEVCVALLRCIDPLPQIARELNRAFMDSAEFIAAIDTLANRWLKGQTDLHILADIWLGPSDPYHANRMYETMRRSGVPASYVEIAESCPQVWSVRTFQALSLALADRDVEAFALDDWGALLATAVAHTEFSEPESCDSAARFIATVNTLANRSGESETARSIKAMLANIGLKIRQRKTSPLDSVLELLHDVIGSVESEREEAQFQAALLHLEGQPEAYAQAVALLCNATDGSWLTSAALEQLASHGSGADALDESLLRSRSGSVVGLAATRIIERHPELQRTHVQMLQWALLEGPSLCTDDAQAIALKLWQAHSAAGWPVILQKIFMAPVMDDPWLAHLTEEDAESLVDCALIAGERLVAESKLVDWLRLDSLGWMLGVPLWSLVLQNAAKSETRQAAINELNKGRSLRLSRAIKLRSIARTFAWGVGIGLMLTGRAMRIQMARDQTLGYTRLDEERIFVSALPLLRGERFGRAVVEGLILHEFGHHRYHRGDEQKRAWDEGQQEGIGRLLNLVADEHLERNLRALDSEFGDKLKKLDAYAFQHSSREHGIFTLYGSLLSDTYNVLIESQMTVARTPGCVMLDHGAVLRALEKAGSSFSRFVRALRMGLGERHVDEKVTRALALFPGAKFRRSTMAELLEISRQVREIFGDEIRLLQVVGSNEDVGQGAEGELDRNTDGISDEEIEREVDRVINPRKSDDDGFGNYRPGGKRWLNVTDDTDFETISEVVRVRYDGSAHRALATRVRRSALTLRRYLERLGLHFVPERLRLRGRRVDAPRTRALVTRGDPRVLIAREVHVSTDLFIGVVIDCSGSMSSGENMPRARLFGALIAEAARSMPGVDVRLFGFTDRVIYDAGNASHPAVHGLDAGGGNNDSAALYYAANVARASKRRAKLLVMISDGLPTECTAASLKNLARQLTIRHKMCCAQIAVQPLSEILFPHYVECNGPDTDLVVKQFGRIIEGLIKRAMGLPA